MKPRKPTHRQKELINHIICEVRQWEMTNDLSSPTLNNDIGVFMVNLDLTDDEQEYLEYILGDLLSFIRGL